MLQLRYGNELLSKPLPVKRGGPQCSVLGPVYKRSTKIPTRPQQWSVVRWWPGPINEQKPNYKPLNDTLHPP